MGKSKKVIQEITAIIYDKRGRVLSIGKNSYVKTHPYMLEMSKKVLQHEHKIFLHAEVDAILKCRDLKKAHKISIFRFGMTGKPLPANPCPICQSAIEAAGIKFVEFT